MSRSVLGAGSPAGDARETGCAERTGRRATDSAARKGEAVERNPDSIFFESQPMSDNKLFYTMLAAGSGIIALFGYGIYRQIIVGEPWGDHPMGDTELLVVGGLYILLGLVFIFGFWRGSLVTEVRPGGLYIRFSPFHRDFRRISLEGVRSCRAIRYRPILDYGGWGIRVGFRKKAYNVSGNAGVEIVYEDGRTVLIGSKKAEQLAGAIESVRR